MSTPTVPSLKCEECGNTTADSMALVVLAIVEFHHERLVLTTDEGEPLIGPATDAIATGPMSRNDLECFVECQRFFRHITGVADAVEEICGHRWVVPHGYIVNL